MQRAYANSGGHGPWARSEAAAEALLTGGEIRGYRLSSSIGLDGAGLGATPLDQQRLNESVQLRFTTGC